jgi:hypothetical protein
MVVAQVLVERIRKRKAPVEPPKASDFDNE